MTTRGHQLGAETQGPAHRCAAAPTECGGLRHLRDLGIGGDESARWLADTVALASTKPAATPAFPLEPTGADAADPLRAAVYRHLEAMERATRARLLRNLVRCLTRSVVATLEGATLDLVCPMAPRARGALTAEMHAEVRRPVSGRLMEQARSATGAQEPVSVLSGEPAPTRAYPASAAAEFAALAHRLEPDFGARLIQVEAVFAFEGHVAATSALTELAGDSEAHPPLDHRDEDALARLRVAWLFARGDRKAARATLEGLPLVLDRSASLGCLRSLLDAQIGREGDSTGVRGGYRRDEFDEPVSGEERQRIARFLSFVRLQPR